MATHSSVLAWRIPGTGEPGGLPSMGSHRVGHDWSDLAAAASCPFFLVVNDGLTLWKSGKEFFEDNYSDQLNESFIKYLILNPYPEVGLLDHIVALRTLFWGSSTLLSVVAALFYTPTRSAQGSWFLHILENTCLLFFFFQVIAILTGMRWCIYRNDFVFFLSIIFQQSCFLKI